ncbi:MAG TPA: hypothetical protein VMH01_05650, partial [Puia sp.]|nr:hypothetical protein [Puia sp.]
MKVRLLTTVTVVIFLFGCSRNTVSLDYTNAKNEVPTLGNLVFRFDKSLVSDSLLGQWDSTQYISFEPKIEGRFRWEHPDELVFSPAKPLSPATTYKASLNSDLLQYTKYSKVKDGDNIKFHTPDLKLDNVNATWVLQDENSTTALPQVNLYFNYPVDPNTLKDKLKLQMNDQPVEYNFQTLTAENKLSIRILNVKMEDKDYEAKILIDKDLVPKGGVNGTADKFEMTSVISSPYVLRINDVSTEQDGVQGTVKVTTSQQVTAADLASFIKFNPSMKFNVEVQDDGFQISTDNFDPEKSYLLTIAKGLHGRIGGVLKDSYSANLAFGQLEPSISFANSKGIYLSAKGEKNIEVRIVSVPKVKIIVSKIYESNLLLAQRYGYRPKESSENENSEESDYYYDNSSTTAGDVIYEQEVDTRSLPRYGNSRVFNFNISDKLPDFKGIYHLMIRSQ